MVVPPFVDTRLEARLEQESTEEDGANEDGVSLHESVVDGGVERLSNVSL